VSFGLPIGWFIPTLLGEVAKFVHFIPQISFRPSPGINHTPPAARGASGGTVPQIELEGRVPRVPILSLRLSRDKWDLAELIPSFNRRVFDLSNKPRAQPWIGNVCEVPVFALRKPAPRPAAQRTCCHASFAQSAAPAPARAEFSQRENFHLPGGSTRGLLPKWNWRDEFHESPFFPSVFQRKMGSHRAHPSIQSSRFRFEQQAPRMRPEARRAPIAFFRIAGWP